MFRYYLDILYSDHSELLITKKFLTIGSVFKFINLFENEFDSLVFLVSDMYTGFSFTINRERNLCDGKF